MEDQYSNIVGSDFINLQVIADTLTAFAPNLELLATKLNDTNISVTVPATLRGFQTWATRAHQAASQAVGKFKIHIQTLEQQLKQEQQTRLDSREQLENEYAEKVTTIEAEHKREVKHLEQQHKVEVERLNAREEKLASELNEIRRVAGKQTTEIGELNRKLSAQSVTAEKEQKDKQLEQQYKAEVERLNAREEKLASELNELRHIDGEQKAKISELDQKLSAQSATAEKEKKDKNHTIQVQSRELGVVRKQLETTKTEQQRLETAVQDRSRNLEQLRQYWSTRDGTIQSLHEKGQNDFAKIRSLEAQVKAETDQHGETRMKQEALQTSLNEEKYQHMQCSSVGDNLQALLEQERQRHKKTSDEREEYQKSANAEHAAFEALRKHSSLPEPWDSDTLIGSHEALHEKYSSLEVSHAKMHKEFDDTETFLNDANEKIGILEADQEALEATYKKLQAEHENLRKHHAHLEPAYGQLQEDYNALDAENAQLCAEREDVITNIQKKNVELKTLRQQLEEVTKLSELRQERYQSMTNEYDELYDVHLECKRPERIDSAVQTKKAPTTNAYMSPRTIDCSTGRPQNPIVIDDSPSANDDSTTLRSIMSLIEGRSSRQKRIHETVDSIRDTSDLRASKKSRVDNPVPGEETLQIHRDNTSSIVSAERALREANGLDPNPPEEDEQLFAAEQPQRAVPSASVEAELSADGLEAMSKKVVAMFRPDWDITQDPREADALNHQVRAVCRKLKKLEKVIEKIDHHVVGRFDQEPPHPRPCLIGHCMRQPTGKGGAKMTRHTCPYCARGKGKELDKYICCWAKHAPGVYSGYGPRVNGKILGADIIWNGSSQPMTTEIDGQMVRWILYRRQERMPVRS